MSKENRDPAISNCTAGTAEGITEIRHQEILLKTGALQSAIFNSANFSSIATDAMGVIQIFNVGAERMLGYVAADVMNKITPADISDPQELIVRAKALSAELSTPITPGFEALAFKASRGIEDIYELTYIRKDGSRFPAVVSVTALRDDQGVIIGYLLIGTDNTARKQVEAERQRLLEVQEETHKQLQRTNVTLQISEEKLAVTLNSIGDAVIATDAEARVTLLNPLAEKLTGWTQAEATGRLVDEIFTIINKETRQPAIIPVMETLAQGTIQGLANHTVLIARDGSECDIADSCAPIRDRDAQVIGAVLVFRDVTSEYAAQQALRDSAAQIQAIINTVVDGIITLHSIDGIIETVNPAAERMFGYTAAELRGQKFSMLIPELDRDQHNGNGSLEYYSASDEACAIGLGREVEGRRKDGNIFPMEIAVSEMWLGGQRYFTGILRDNTVRKQIEERYRTLFESIDEGFCIIEMIFDEYDKPVDYRFLEVNPSFERQTGIHEATGKRIRELAPNLETHWFEIYGKVALTGEPVRYANEAKALGGRWFDVYAFPVDKRDRCRVAILFTDVTERNLQDQALREKNIELENARAVADKANLAKSDFLSSMSHELRSPLNAILGFAQLMESDSTSITPSQKNSLAFILQAGWHLLTLINEILDLATVESGKVPLLQEPVALDKVMLECQSMIENQAEQHGIKLTFPQFDIPLYVRADRTRLKQVLINLLSNAIKYNSKQGKAEVTCIESTPGRVRISIEDSGAGLHPEQMAQLFQPFNRLGQEAGSEEGTGIGLVLSKQLVELMGGSIGVRSTVGVGSVFWFELNLAAKPHLSMEGAETTALFQVPVLSSALPHSLLYLEDNPANMQLVEDIISRHPDIQLLTAMNGHDGIEIARTSQPSVIMMDINLPGISGLEVLKILREDPTTAHIPVIAISANALPLDIEKGLKAGLFLYITKPIKIKEFMEAVNMALEFSERKGGQKS